MSKLHELLCPQCGAQVPPVGPDVRIVVCHFCQHQYELDHARAAREERIAQAAKSHKPPPSSAAGAAVSIIVAVLALAGGTIFMLSRSSSKPEHEHDIDWDSAGDPPRIADVNGDGTEDLIGTYWKPEKGEGRGEHNIELGAFDGATHVTVWTAGPYGRSNSSRGVTGVTHVAVAGTRVVIVDLTANAHILDIKSGKETGAVKLPDRVRAVCAAPSGTEVWADVLGDRGMLLDLGRAAATPAPRPVYCLESAPGSCLAHRGRSTCSLPHAAVPGVRIDRVLSDANDSIALGVGDGSVTTISAPASRDGGVRTIRSSVPAAPTVVGLHKPTQAILWQTVLGASVPGVTSQASPSSVAELADGRVYAQYELKNASWRLACLDAKTGTVIWDVKVLGNKHGDEARSIVASKSRVYLAHGDWLDLFDRATGQQLGNFGK